MFPRTCAPKNLGSPVAMLSITWFPVLMFSGIFLHRNSVFLLFVLNTFDGEAKHLSCLSLLTPRESRYWGNRCGMLRWEWRERDLLVSWALRNRKPSSLLHLALFLRVTLALDDGERGGKWLQAGGKRMWLSGCKSQPPRTKLTAAFLKHRQADDDLASRPEDLQEQLFMALCCD